MNGLLSVIFFLRVLAFYAILFYNEYSACGKPKSGVVAILNLRGKLPIQELSLKVAF